MPKPVGTLKKSLVDQSEGAQRCKTSLPVTTKSQGGSGGGAGGWVGGGVRSLPVATV